MFYTIYKSECIEKRNNNIKKDFGIYAKCDIKKHTLLLLEHPVSVLNNAILVKILYFYPEFSKLLFPYNTNTELLSTLHDKVKKNAYTFEKKISSLNMDASHFNHECINNCGVFFYFKDGNIFTCIYTLKDIQIEDELNVNYNYKIGHENNYNKDISKCICKRTLIERENNFINNCNIMRDIQKEDRTEIVYKYIKNNYINIVINNLAQKGIILYKYSENYEVFYTDPESLNIDYSTTIGNVIKLNEDKIDIEKVLFYYNTIIKDFDGDMKGGVLFIKNILLNKFN